MALRRVRITGFRCIASAELALDPARNCISGANGAGKTSLLEAIFLLARGRSFRTRRTGSLLAYGADALTVYGEVDDGPIVRRLGARFAQGHLDKHLDGEVAKGSTLAEILPIQSIGPDSHELIEGGPRGRRRLLDWGVFHVEPSYLEVWQRYRRALGQRNMALKKRASPAALSVWTAALVEAGETIDARRASYLATLAATAREHAHALLGVELALEYRRGWSNGASLEEALASFDAHDRLSGRTHVGPHRADVSILAEGRDVGEVVSRGQQKLIAAALILGQETALEGTRSAKGLLLVDDPAAELDPRALDRLLDRLARVRGQLILTSIDPLRLPSQLTCTRFHVEQGRVDAL